MTANSWDIDVDYKVLQRLIDTFERTRAGFETLAASGCPSAGSDDPVAHHHVSAVKSQEMKLLLDAVTSFTHARDGAQAAYDAFVDADDAGGSSNRE